MGVFDPNTDVKPLFDTKLWNDLFSEIAGGVADATKVAMVSDMAENELRLVFTEAGGTWPPSATAKEILKPIYQRLFQYHAFLRRRGTVEPDMKDDYLRALDEVKAAARGDVKLPQDLATEAWKVDVRTWGLSYDIMADLLEKT